MATLRVAQAQELQRLTVESFVLAADTITPKVDAPFHLVVTLRVRERVPEIANLDLPLLAQLDVLGDEHETTSGPQGTRYREMITVAAHTPGAIAIAPATLQAVDARDGKAKEWFTDALTLDVAGRPVIDTAGPLLLRALLWLLAIASLGAIAVLLVRRRSRVVASVPVAPSPPPPPQSVVARTRRQQAQDALTVLQRERTRAAAAMVRAAIWRMVGASEGETLGDVLQRPGSDEAVMRELLISLERSAFTYESDLHSAIDDACSALERYIGSA